MTCFHTPATAGHFFARADINQHTQDMRLTVNGKEVETQASTLQQLADELALPPQGVALAIDNRMVPRTAWGEQPLAEGDSLVVIKAACGG